MWNQYSCLCDRCRKFMFLMEGELTHWCILIYHSRKDKKVNSPFLEFGVFINGSIKSFFKTNKTIVFCKPFAICSVDYAFMVPSLWASWREKHWRSQHPYWLYYSKWCMRIIREPSKTLTQWSHYPAIFLVNLDFNLIGEPLKFDTFLFE